MAREITNCRAFADINKCILLLDALKSEYRSFEELQTYFSNDVIIIMNLEDTLLLFEVLGYLNVIKENTIEKYKALNIDFNPKLVIHDILKFLIDNNLCEINRIDIDFYIQIRQEFYAFRNLLILSEAIIKSKINRFYRIDSIFSNHLLTSSKKVSKEQFLKKLEKQSEIAEEAEKYVLELESKKFKFERKIRHVALEDNNAGYDIMSFMDFKSNEFDKFIEVKCYSLHINRFFISRNEVTQSKKLGKNYFLYLVESKLDSPPIIIQNPYFNIFNNSDINYEIENISYNIKDILSQFNK